MTLLLSHAPSQGLTQQRLESYLSALASPSLDLSERLDAEHLENGDRLRRQQQLSAQSGGTNTPRDLNSRLKLLELYTLHVLPRNEEWDYAREFIEISEYLDDERREAFLQTLHSIREEQTQTSRDAAAARQREDERLARERQEATQSAAKEATNGEARPSEEPDESGQTHRRGPSEIDYGIESHPNGHSNISNATSTNPPKARAPQAAGTRLSPKPTLRRPVKKTAASPGLYRRASEVIDTMRRLARLSSESLQTNPIILLRTLFFLIGLLLALSRQDVRYRIRRITALGWDKVKGTVGMGVKVSYI